MNRTVPLSFLRAVSCGILLVLATALANAQPRRLPPNLQDPDQLKPEDGERVLEAFRQVAPVGDVVADFTLTFEPYRDQTRRFEGRFFGTWLGAPRTRVELPEQAGMPARHWLLWNGMLARGWQWEENGEVATIAADDLFSPLVPETTLTPFDLQLPFIYWQEYAYEGTKRVKGRAAHFFLLYPPEDDARYAHLGGVRVVLDADFNAMLSAEILSPEGAELKSIKVQSFKKLNGQWIVKRIDLIDEVTRDRTRFELLAASVGPSVERRWFEPETLDKTADLPGVLDQL